MISVRVILLLYCSSLKKNVSKKEFQTQFSRMFWLLLCFWKLIHLMKFLMSEVKFPFVMCSDDGATDTAGVGVHGEE